mmetsp:Transcript_503/g.847  ORF Transcript_503/g.847 Transcript_503/m.847 type:complete len:396 (+) Transcript_503:1265-2452(+)
MEENLLRSLDLHVENLDILLASYFKSGESLSVIKKAPVWKHDIKLQQLLSDIKSGSNLVVQTCIKIALLSVNIGVDLSPLFNDLLAQCSSLHSTYLLFLDQSLSRCLFEWVSRAIREFFTHIRSVIVNIVQNPSAVTYLVGLVTRIHEEDILKFPLANKVAFRRYIMQCCSVVKETAAEFRTYLSESTLKIKAGEASEVDIDDNGETGSNDDDEDEDDEEVEHYSSQEVSVVSVCVSLMDVTLDIMKFALSSITSISDAIYSTGTEDTMSSVDDRAELCAINDNWVESVTTASKQLESLVIDLGSELYPPLSVSPKDMSTFLSYSNSVPSDRTSAETEEGSSELVMHFLQLHRVALQQLTLLEETALAAFHNEEFSRGIRSLRNRLALCIIQTDC